MYILREGYNAVGRSIVAAHCIHEMLSIYQFLSSWTELWGGSTCGSPAVLPWSAHYMELWASPLLSFLSFVFTAMSSQDIIALAIVDMFSRITAILLTRSLLAGIHLVPLKGPIQNRDSNIASAYWSLRLYISSPHWQQEGKTIVTRFSPFRVSWLRKEVADNAFWADGGQLVQGKKPQGGCDQPRREASASARRFGRWPPIAWLCTPWYCNHRCWKKYIRCGNDIN